jgi:tagatose kinase
MLATQPGVGMKKIVVIGEILVEIMADHPGTGFLTPLALTGPYPSGAPAIFIDQVARLGQAGAIVSMVGADDFGQLCLARLRADGVDLSGVEISSDRPTGSAFVRYRPDGARDFLFNIRHSACGLLPRGPGVARVLAAADHLHVMGSSLSSPEVRELTLQVAQAVKARGGSLSFDPNLRTEIRDAPGWDLAMRQILRLTDVFLPSGDELFLLTEAKEPEAAVRALLAAGPSVIVHKLGAQGLHYHSAQGSRRVAALRVQEVDPTGAGDCFGATFVSLWLRGTETDEALTLAAAAGALAVSRRGPMEGAFELASIRAFAQAQGRLS